jgi:diguanylate cyclase (GGDEF)-like protein
MMQLSDVSFLKTVVENELSSRRFGLKLHPDLQSLFEQEMAVKKRRETVWAILFSMLLFNAFLVRWFFEPGSLTPSVIFIHLGAVTLPSILSLRLLAKDVTEPLRNSVILFASILVLLAVAYMFSDDANQSEIFTPFVFPLFFLARNNLVPIRFNYAVFATAIDLIVMTPLIILSPILQTDACFMALMVMYLTAIVSLISSYRIEKNAINSFLNMLLKSLHHIEMREANHHLSMISGEDPLTGIANRREFETRFKRSWERAVDNLTSYAVLMIDVDHFKSYNDKHGHLKGDECLRRIAQEIQKQIRSSHDFAARLGGEEFCVLLPGAEEIAARMIAERIGRAIEDLAIPHNADESIEHVTVSIGVATAIARFCDDEQQIVAAADEALYEAKRTGRNRNCAARLGIAA